MFQCLCVCARACVCVCVCVQVCVIGCTVSQQFPKSQAFGHGQGEGVVYRKWTDVDKGGGGEKKTKIVPTFFIDGPSAFISILIDK